MSRKTVFPNIDGSISVGGKTALSSVSLIRPNDTTAYDAKDAIANSAAGAAVLLFVNVAIKNGGSGYITKVRLFTSQSTNVAIYRLQLYTSTPTSINDNAPFTLLIANQAKRVGFIDAGPANTEGTGSDSANAMNADVRMPFVCAAADTKLYGILETLTAFTPAALQTFFIELTVEQN